MPYKFSLIIIFFFGWVFSTFSFPDKGYYIIDSAQVENLSEHDRSLIEKALKIYYNETSDLLTRFKSISYLTDHLNDNCWYEYNNWLIYQCQLLGGQNNLTSIEKHGIERLLAASYNNLGYSLTSTGDLDSGLYYHRKSLLLYYQIKNLSGIAQAFNNIGFIYGEQGLTQLQIRNYSYSLKIREAINDPTGTAVSLNNIGFIYKKINNYEKALEFYTKSLKISRSLNDQPLIASTLNNISLIYIKLENYKKAKLYLKESCAIREQRNDYQGISMCYESIGTIFEKQNLTDSAEHYYNLSLNIRKSINDKKGVASSLYMLGHLYHLRFNKEKAVQSLTRSLEKSQEINNASLILSTSKLLGKIYQGQHDYKNSLKMFRLYSSLNDSIIQSSISDELEKQQNVARLEKKNTIHKLNAKFKDDIIKKSKKDFKIILTILIISVIIFLILILILKLKIKANSAQKEQIDTTNKELSRLNDKQKKLLTIQETLLKEIHHRVKNNLQVITSLLALQSSFIDDNKIKKIFRYTQYRINSMAMVHEMLYHTEDLSKISLNNYINKLSTNLVNSMKGSNNNIKLKIEIPDLYLNIDTVIPLGLLINEILTNSLKYGVTKQACNIYIQIIHLGNNNFIMYIGDNGNGFSDETLFRSANSLGLILIHNLTLQLKGSIEKNNNLEGTNYIVTFKENLTSLKNYEENISSRR